MISREQQTLITVVIPTYRRPQLLGRAIQSVLDQTYSNFRLKIYDNCSGDETESVVNSAREKDARISYFCHPTNIGAIGNFNFGMRQIDTPYFCLLGDDNYLLPDFFEEAVRRLDGLSERTIFVGGIESVDDRGRLISRNLQKWPAGLVRAPDTIMHIVDSGFPNWEGILFRQQVIDEGRFLDPGFAGAADQEFIVRIAGDYDFYVSKKICARFTHHSESWTSNRALSEYLTNMNTLLERWLKEYIWTADQEERLRLAIDHSNESALRGYVIKNAIIGDDLDTLSAASEYLSDRRTVSNKTNAVIKFAKFANTNPILKYAASHLAKLHLMKHRVKIPSTF